MDIKEALQIVLDLAQQNVIEYHHRDKYGTNAEHLKQTEACNMVEALTVNQFGDS